MLRQWIPLILVFGLVSCGDDDPAWCENSGPLETACTRSTCIASVVIDYKRLDPRGYRVFGVEGSPLASQQDAEAKAQDYLYNELRQPTPDNVDTIVLADFYFVYLTYLNRDSWLILLHAPTGQVLFSGLEKSADFNLRGYDFALPTGYQNAQSLGCADNAGEPEKVYKVTTGQPMIDAPASTAEEAWQIAKRLNLTAQFTAGKSYNVMVNSYAPAINEFDAASADWYVWIYWKKTN